MFLPHDATPATSTTSQSTTPSGDEEFCNFQENECEFLIEGDGDFIFTRTKGSQVEAIGSDRNGNADGMFLYAQSGEREPTSVYTYVMTTEFSGEKHEVECFHFWFYIDGFFVGTIVFVITYLFD